MAVVSVVPLIGITQPGSPASRIMPVESPASVWFFLGVMVVPKLTSTALCLFWMSVRAVPVGVEPSASTWVPLIRPHFFVASGGFAVVVWQRSIALARSLPVTPVNLAAVLQLDGATVSEVAASQSLSRASPTTSNAPGLTSDEASLQSPLQYVHPSPSASETSSAVPLQSSSIALAQISETGITWPVQVPQSIPLGRQVCVPATHGPTFSVPGAP